MPSVTRRYQLLYFTFFAAGNGFVVFRNAYFEELGLTGGQMGVLGAVLVLGGIAAQPVWGVLADRFGAARRILLIAAAASGVVILAFPYAAQLAAPFTLLVLASALLAVVRSPIVPVANAMVLSAGLEYGRVRAFGSIAFGIGTFVLGWVLATTGTAIVFYVYAVGMVAMILIVRGVPEPEAAPDITPDLRRDAVRLLTDHRYVVLLVTATVLGGVSLAGAAYFAVYVRAVGGGDGLTGSAWALRTLAEAAVFVGAARISMPERSQLTLGAGLYAVAYLVYASVPVAAAIVAVQVLVGVGLALYNLAVVQFAHRFSPEELSSTAQAVLFSIGIGTGRAIGELFAGGLLDAVGVQSMYYALAAGAMVAMLVSTYFHAAEWDRPLPTPFVRG